VQTAFVANLGNLRGVPRRAQAVALASTAQSEVQARFLTDSIGMLARYHQTQTPLARLLVRKAIIGQDRKRAIVAEAPVDYVSWIRDVSYFANRRDLRSLPSHPVGHWPVLSACEKEFRNSGLGRSRKDRSDTGYGVSLNPSSSRMR